MNSFRKHDRYLASTQNPDPRTYLLNLDFFAESENQKSSFMLQTQQYWPGSFTNAAAHLLTPLELGERSRQRGPRFWWILELRRPKQFIESISRENTTFSLEQKDPRIVFYISLAILEEYLIESWGIADRDLIEFLILVIGGSAGFFRQKSVSDECNWSCWHTWRWEYFS